MGTQNSNANWAHFPHVQLGFGTFFFWLPRGGKIANFLICEKYCLRNTLSTKHHSSLNCGLSLAWAINNCSTWPHLKNAISQRTRFLFAVISFSTEAWQVVNWNKWFRPRLKQ